MFNGKLPKPDLKPEDLKPGDVLLFPPNKMFKGWVGQSIVLLTKGTVSHAALYRGEENGTMIAAHAAPGGIAFLSFLDLLKSEPGCFVMRHTEKADLHPVLTAIDSYTDHENPYPFFNLGILGLLLLANRFSSKTLRNHIFYDLASLVSVRLMKAMQVYRHPGKNPMSCSQFAVQCFTDAGSEYDIRFSKLLIQFGKLNATGDKISLLSLLDEDDLLDFSEVNMVKDYTSDEETVIAKRFVEWFSNEENEYTGELVDAKDLNKVSRDLLMILCQAFTNKKPATVEDAMELLATDRNYLVAPEDLFVNTLNLEKIGYMDKSVL